MSQEAIRRALEDVLEEMGVTGVEVRLDQPKDSTHGDLASNLALTLASTLGLPPRTIAEEIVTRLKGREVTIEAVEVAGPGFLNFRLSTDEIASLLTGIIEAEEHYGKSDEGHGESIMVEFVSANPTGPLHLGHGRQGSIGDAIASLLEWTGWMVTREYYYNDAGAQIDRLAESVWVRYQQLFGEDAQLPEGGYQGAYVSEIASGLVEAYGDRFVGNSDAEALGIMRNMAIRVLRKEQDRDLSTVGIHFDGYFLESSLYEDGRIKSTVEALRETGKVFDQDGAVWLRTTEYGDQKDRVMIKSDGSPTYFLPDVAYHMNKWERGFHHVINVQGADHHGTVARVHAGLQALGLPSGYPEYVLHQMVRVERDGQEVKFSKRAGSYTTLRKLMSEVGVDVTRYFFQMRKPDGHLIFDLSLALDQSDKNPVFKIQYAHARMCSIFKKTDVDRREVIGRGIDLSVLKNEMERELVKQLGRFPDSVSNAARLRAPHLICDYLEQTAGAVNSWYHAGNPSRNPELSVLVDDVTLRTARLALVRSVQIVLRNGLQILGIRAPERMTREDEEITS
ncbi:MAG: arginine--tRNA ligase [Gemmatimonadota bacterium]|nr:arginine--tRNA ligase [Gemmatimonadota bacterium]